MEQLLNELEQKYPDDQGENSWLHRTRNSIGGSSMCYFTGNGRGNLDNFVLERVFKGEDGGFLNDAMRWGSLMENVARLYLSVIFLKTRIYVTGDIPYIKKDDRLLCHYSMDGIFTSNLHELIGLDFPDEELNYLLELKCPWSREIKTYKTNRCGIKGTCIVANNYLDQVKMGLCVVDLSEAGCFIDFLFRASPFEYMNEENKFKFSKDQTCKNELNKVLASGIIKFYLKGNDEKPIDYGNNLNYILNKHKDFTHTISINEGLITPDIIKEEDFIGYLCFKLFDTAFRYIPKNKDFIKLHIDKICDISNLLYDCELLDEDEKIALVENFDI